MDVLEFLMIKSKINNIKPESSWVIKREKDYDTQEFYIVLLNDGSQTHNIISFSKYKYTLMEVYFICGELSELLDVEFVPFNPIED